MIAEYSKQVVELCGRLMKILSINLRLLDDFLKTRSEAKTSAPPSGSTFNQSILSQTSRSACHNTPILAALPSYCQTRTSRDSRSGEATRWIMVNPVPDAFIVNIRDQMQVLSNANYKSVEHRMIVNSGKERVSLAYFYNPRGDILIKPAEELVTEDHPALYPPMTFNEYRLYIRTKGPRGKSQVEALKSPR